MTLASRLRGALVNGMAKSVPMTALILVLS
jgi:hypothetical protein